jgi:ubiquinone/menaquinone biosynthesis C-methylase UbiE
MNRAYAPVFTGFTFAKSLVYFLEGLPLTVVQRALYGRAPQATKEFEAAVLKQAQNIVLADTKNITDGIYPASVLVPPDMKDHVSTYLRILADGVFVQLRKFRRKHQEFSADSNLFMGDVPDYYKRNFHFQTDGYLSGKSAEIYDHQVEILFRGLADAMRRLFIRPLKEQGWSDERPMKVLEIGTGTGSCTRMFVESFPSADVTCLDLSHPYLKKAQTRLKSYPKINFVQGDGANVPFGDGSFDGTFSAFLFHELPSRERMKVLKEGLRVLRPGGFMAIVDSLQKDDVPELNFGLEQFPKEFHEPFYKNYTEEPMEPLLAKAGFENISQGTGFFSKWLVAHKPS